MEAKMYVRKERFDDLARAQARIRALEAGAVAGLVDVAAGWLIPRGPVTTVEALTAAVAALAVGFAAGWLMRSRWAMLLTPTVSKNYVVFENSGHTPPFDEPGRFAVLIGDVRIAAERSP
jgi:pimeloyl-ACP methyl ester carboxylesterase